MLITIEFNEDQTLEALQREKAFINKEYEKTWHELAEQNKKTLKESLDYPTLPALKNKIKNYFKKRKNKVYVSEDMVSASDKITQENQKLYEEKYQTLLMIENRMLTVCIAIDKQLERKVYNAS